MRRNPRFLGTGRRHSGGETKTALSGAQADAMRPLPSSEGARPTHAKITPASVLIPQLVDPRFGQIVAEPRNLFVLCSNTNSLEMV